jgi:hypothetical protein
VDRDDAWPEQIDSTLRVLEPHESVKPWLVLVTVVWKIESL